MIAPSPSAILYQDPQATTFLIDIPASIARAQSLSPSQSSALLPSARSPSNRENDRNRRLLSTPPLRVPYPARTEPKTDAARARVLERTPLAERLLHSEILEPLVTEGLSRIRGALASGAQWCLPRVEIDPSAQALSHNGDISDEAPLPKKRKGTAGRARSNSHGELDAAMKQIASASATSNAACASLGPPLILSPGLNRFSCMSELSGIVVQNTSLESATVHATRTVDQEITQCCHSGSHYLSSRPVPHSFYIPPLSSFLQCRIPISTTPGTHAETPIPGLPHHRKFDLILLDPPWANRSVRRSGHYHTQTYLDWELLTQRIRNVLSVHLVQDSSSSNKEADAAGLGQAGRPGSAIAAIWITNSGKARKTAYDAIQGAGLTVCEEWVWVKTTTEGESITPVGALWRKPYEILVIGRKRADPPASAARDDDGHPAAKAGEDGITRRVIAAVPDVHSRKPNLREVFEQVFFYDSSPRNQPGIRYTALEVFARNLTAGWWAVGDEALKFNAEEWWVES